MVTSSYYAALLAANRVLSLRDSYDNLSSDRVNSNYSLDVTASKTLNKNSRNKGVARYSFTMKIKSNIKRF